MEQVKELDTHKYWKHLKSGKLYTIMGYGLWMGLVSEVGNDMQQVIAYRVTDDTDFEVVPSQYPVSGVRSADAALVQTTQPLSREDRVVVYTGPHYELGDRVYVRRHEDFFDGRFVKTDALGNELSFAKKIKPKAEPEASQS